MRDTLLEYARRGVFRGFDHRETDEGIVFQFFWMGPRPYQLVLSSGEDEIDTLTARRLLPAVDQRSDLRSDLEGLLAERTPEAENHSSGEERPPTNAVDEAERLPPHRRIDPTRATAELAPDGHGGLELVLSVRGGHHEYGARKMLNLINEIWVRLQDRHQRYLWEEFQAPME